MSYTLTLTPKQISQSIRQGKIVFSMHWLDGFISGGALTALSWMMLLVHFDADPTLRWESVPLLLLALAIPVAAGRGVWRERHLTRIDTGLTLPYNRLLMLAVFERLAWYVSHEQSRLLKAQLPHGRFAAHGQLVCVLLAPQAVYVNASHYGTGRGKLPFFFARNQLVLEQVLREIQTQIPLTRLS